MKIGATGCGKAQLVGELRKVGCRVERLLAAHDLYRGTSRGTEVRRKRTQLCLRQAVLRRMRQNGGAAGADDPAHDLR